MPYVIVKTTRNGRVVGYRVRTKNRDPKTGKYRYFSKSRMSLERAKRQIRVLYMHERRQKTKMAMVKKRKSKKRAMVKKQRDIHVMRFAAGDRIPRNPIEQLRTVPRGWTNLTERQFLTRKRKFSNGTLPSLQSMGITFGGGLGLVAIPRDVYENAKRMKVMMQRSRKR